MTELYDIANIGIKDYSTIRTALEAYATNIEHAGKNFHTQALKDMTAKQAQAVREVAERVREHLRAVTPETPTRGLEIHGANPTLPTGVLGGLARVSCEELGGAD